MVESEMPRRPDTKVPKPIRRRRKRPTRWYWRFVQLSVAAYLAVLVTMAYLENRLVYPGAFADNSGNGIGESIDVRDLDQRRLAAASVQTVRYGGGGEIDDPTDDNLPGRLWMSSGDEPSRDWIIFFHGNGIRAVDLDSWLIRIGKAMNANVFAAEYRGFTDDRVVSESGVIADGIAAVRFVMRTFNVSPSRMVFWGRSLGGGVASAAAVEFGPAAVVMDRTFDSAVQVAAAKYWFLPVWLVMKNRFDSAARMQVYRGPLVVTHGRPDQLVPFAAGQRLYDAAASDAKTLVVSEAMGHLDPMDDPTFDNVVDSIGQMIRQHDSGRQNTSN